MVECVPNVSEGRDPATIRLLASAIAATPEVVLFDQTSDPDHHRSVFTFAGPPGAVLAAALAVARIARARIDLNAHCGVHPRIGALDVLPFVPLEGSSMDECVQLAHTAGNRIWNELGMPVYFYERAALRPERVRLEEVRRGQFEGLSAAALQDPGRRPDVGGPALHPTAGAVAVGARKFLVAFNLTLATSDVAVARAIARRIRASSGGLPGVKALGLLLASRNQAQVSMNLTDLDRTPLHVVVNQVRALAAEHGVAVGRGELIGLLPRQAVNDTVAASLHLPGFDEGHVIEARIEGQRSPAAPVVYPEKDLPF